MIIPFSSDTTPDKAIISWKFPNCERLSRTVKSMFTSFEGVQTGVWFVWLCRSQQGCIAVQCACQLKTTGDDCEAVLKVHLLSGPYLSSGTEDLLVWKATESIMPVLSADHLGYILYMTGSVCFLLLGLKTGDSDSQKNSSCPIFPENFRTSTLTWKSLKTQERQRLSYLVSQKKPLVAHCKDHTNPSLGWSGY